MRSAYTHKHTYALVLKYAFRHISNTYVLPHHTTCAHMKEMEKGQTTLGSIPNLHYSLRDIAARTYNFTHTHAHTHACTQTNTDTHTCRWAIAHSHAYTSADQTTRRTGHAYCKMWRTFVSYFDVKTSYSHWASEYVCSVQYCKNGIHPRATYSMYTYICTSHHTEQIIDTRTRAWSQLQLARIDTSSVYTQLQRRV